MFTTCRRGHPLVGLYHLAEIGLLTPKGRSELLFTFILFGTVLTIAGIWLLRADLAPLFAPSRYDVTVGLLALVIMLYYLSWVTESGKALWRLVVSHSPLSVAHMYPVIGIGFLLTFALASCVWGFHLVVMLSPRLRQRFRPSLLSHLAALLLLIPSLKLSSNLAAIRESFFSVSPGTSNQSVELTATRTASRLSMTKTLSPRASLALGGGSSLLSR